MGDPEKIFEKRERIGKGSFGEVFKGYDSLNSIIVSFADV
jgi:hypothetical protein